MTGTTLRNLQISERAATGNGTYIFPLSSEEPYRRWDGMEILSHEDDAVDLTWLNSGNAPLLDGHNNHELRNQIGVVVKAWMENKRVYVEVKFSARAEAQAIKQDVDDGVIRNVSVGYKRDQIVRDEDSDEYLVSKWTPIEASFVPIPADQTVGMGRSATMESHMTTKTDKTQVQGDGVVAPGQMSDEQRAEAFVQATNEISELASEHSMSDVARNYINHCVREGAEPSLAYFKGILRAKLPEDKPLRNDDVGLTEQETRQFSVVKAMRAMSDGDWRGAEFEQEAVRAAEEKAEDGTKHGGIFLPSELMRNWGNFEADGVDYRSNLDLVRAAALSTSGNPNILTTDHLASRFIDNLRNQSAFLRAGATMLNGLSSNVEIPGGDANIAAAWLASEDADVAESNPTFRKVTLAPNDLGAYTDVTRRMLQQSTIAMEAYIRMQMVDAMRIAIDLAAGYGSGASGVPEGLSNTTGIGSVTFGAAVPTRDEIIDLRTSIADTNRGRGVTYIGNSSMVGDLQKTKVDAGSGVFLMGDSADRLVGNSFIESNQITDGDLFCGVFTDMLIGMWGSMELARSTEAKFLSGGLRFRVIQTVDVDFTRVGSFSLGNDTL